MKAPDYTDLIGCNNDLQPCLAPWIPIVGAPRVLPTLVGRKMWLKKR
jgi:hypothetical protein